MYVLQYTAQRNKDKRCLNIVNEIRKVKFRTYRKPINLLTIIISHIIWNLPDICLNYFRTISFVCYLQLYFILVSSKRVKIFIDHSSLEFSDVPLQLKMIYNRKKHNKLTILFKGFTDFTRVVYKITHNNKQLKY